MGKLDDSRLQELIEKGKELMELMQSGKRASASNCRSFIQKMQESEGIYYIFTKLIV